MTETSDAPTASRFRTTLIKVLSIQVVTLAILWWLEARYTA